MIHTSAFVLVTLVFVVPVLTLVLGLSPAATRFDEELSFSLSRDELRRLDLSGVVRAAAETDGVEVPDLAGELSPETVELLPVPEPKSDEVEGRRFCCSNLEMRSL